MKKVYIAPEIEMIRLKTIDVITASTEPGDLVAGEDDLPWIQ